MDLLTLKLILIFFMGLVPIIFGLMPLKLYMHLTHRNKGQLGKNSAIAISLLSCFAGGVILGVCLLELLPEARESLESIERRTNWKSGYPYVELFIGVGLFIVYFVEELIGKIFGLKHDHKDEGAKEAFSHIEDGLDGKKVAIESTSTTSVSDDSSSQRPITPVTISSTIDSSAEAELKRTRKKALINACTFVLALVLHTSLEGFAFGIQDQIMSVSSLFFGIITHKALVSFSVGMSLARALSHNKKMVVLLVVALAIFSPVGGLIGIVVQSTGSETTGKSIVTAILTCFSIGTFLYIAFFEILAPERSTDHPKLLQWLACVLGFLSMAGFLALGEGHGEHGGHESR